MLIKAMIEQLKSILSEDTNSDFANMSLCGFLESAWQIGVQPSINFAVDQMKAHSPVKQALGNDLLIDYI